MGGWFQKIFMILKFQWWFLNLCVFKNHFWNHKTLGHVMPAGAFGAVRPVGAILPTATAAGPILTKPRTATPLRRPLPASNVQMIVTNDESFPCLAMPIWHWPEPNKWQMIHRQITMSLEKRKRTCKTNNTKLLSCLRRRDKVFWFSTLLTTAIWCYVLIIRRLAG